MTDGVLRAERGSPERPDAVVTADPSALAAVVYAGRDLDAFIETGAIRVEGDRQALERFTKLFPKREPAPAA
ncbi:hypothetical protein D3C72_2032330 [compost metagenome]